MASGKGQFTMQAYEGYFENGKFYSVGQSIQIPERQRVILTVLDEPITEHKENEQARAWRDFFNTINASDEEIPETFERFSISREVEI